MDRNITHKNSMSVILVKVSFYVDVLVCCTSGKIANFFLTPALQYGSLEYFKTKL